ncbi:rubrerythrin family protein [Clostridium sp. BJN0001]|uniref:rubrerythrin family protein n=1 Tax=Clostridium sp. BJN0001 TaxID=2930219 RepID=UPI001FD1EF8C|nr:rubrerythrin family protein [Clostridium sp. BJN0001]
MDLKGSKTEKNLFKTFAGESRARTKYTLYAEKAAKEELIGIRDTFNVISGNELAHAREVYEKYLNRVGETKNNLIEAALGEAHESRVLYKEFEKVAREEGFTEIANFYKELQEVEESHDEIFVKLAKDLKNDKLFKSDKKALWKCLNCGYIYEGYEVPPRCPLCKYPRGYFQKMDYVECNGGENK